MKKLIMLIVMMVGVYGSQLDITTTDKKIAELICLNKGGVKVLEVGGYVTCNNGFVGDESALLEYNTNTSSELLATVEGFNYVCVDDTNTIWAIDNSDGASYRVTWVGLSNVEEFLKCDDFQIYKNIYIVNEED